MILIGILAVVVCKIVQEKHKKIISIILTLCTIFIAIIGCIKVTPICLDYFNQDYIELSDVTLKSNSIMWSGLMLDRRVDVILDDGSSVKMYIYEDFEMGIYCGRIIYAPKSKIIVFSDLEKVN
jgi:hypothetical protein